jgi:hypothetical protein
MLLAMQKVEGSSPFSRSEESPAEAVFFVGQTEVPRAKRRTECQIGREACTRQAPEWLGLPGATLMTSFRREAGVGVRRHDGAKASVPLSARGPRCPRDARRAKTSRRDLRVRSSRQARRIGAMVGTGSVVRKSMMSVLQSVGFSTSSPCEVPGMIASSLSGRLR